jgi:AraC-like DNA-binding protein
MSPVEYAGPVLGTSSMLDDLVEWMADWDIARPDQAQALILKVTPSVGPKLVIHYRTPIAATWRFGSRGFTLPGYRQFATKCQTGVVVARPCGALGAIAVRLKPEAASRLLGERMQRYLDTRIDLDDLFGAVQISLLEEMLSETRTSTERFALVERFLVAHLHAPGVTPIACQAATLLRRNSHLRVCQIAERLDVSERHMSRSFRTMFGMSPKQFARIVRFERVMVAWAQGKTWADIACKMGFFDQAHMINDFVEIVGVSPTQLFNLHSN